jgi:hypothetical protein
MLGLAAILLGQGCGSSTDDESEAISARQLQGVWVFHHDPDGWDDAAFSGVGTIEDNCLLVNGTVVVWHRQRSQDPAWLIAEIETGNQPYVRLGGSLLDKERAPADYASVVFERCPVQDVWFASPDPLKQITP